MELALRLPHPCFRTCLGSSWQVRPSWSVWRQIPSAQGVCEAFLACEAIMSESFISWCSVVGNFFDSGERLKSKAETEDTVSTASLVNLKGHSSQPKMSKSDSGLSVVIPEPNKIRKNTKSRPTVRDLAILPTQRIMRHVLLLKGTCYLSVPLLSLYSLLLKNYIL